MAVFSPLGILNTKYYSTCILRTDPLESWIVPQIGLHCAYDKEGYTLTQCLAYEFVYRKENMQYSYKHMHIKQVYEYNKCIGVERMDHVIGACLRDHKLHKIWAVKSGQMQLSSSMLTDYINDIKALLLPCDPKLLAKWTHERRWM
jgi:hypothetical protein